MTNQALLLGSLLVGALVASAAGPAPDQESRASVSAIERVLDDFHDAASKADGERYFGCFAANAIFLGTDATERWTLPEFRAFAEPYFEAGTGWTYLPRERNVTIGAGGRTGWFDELLESPKYGQCRGTGVVVRSGKAWRIAQYNLSFPIPNEIASEVVAIIRRHKAGD